MKLQRKRVWEWLVGFHMHSQPDVQGGRPRSNTNIPEEDFLWEGREREATSDPVLCALYGPLAEMRE